MISSVFCASDALLLKKLESRPSKKVASCEFTTTDFDNTFPLFACPVESQTKATAAYRAQSRIFTRSDSESSSAEIVAPPNSAIKGGTTAFPSCSQAVTSFYDKV